MQLDVFEYGEGGYTQLVVLVQSNIVETPGRFVAIPLAPNEDFSGGFIRDLFPVVDFGGAQYRLMTPDLAGVAVRKLGDKVGNLRHYETGIKDAINLLFWGVR